MLNQNVMLIITVCAVVIGVLGIIIQLHQGNAQFKQTILIIQETVLSGTQPIQGGTVAILRCKRPN